MKYTNTFKWFLITLLTASFLFCTVAVHAEDISSSETDRGPEASSTVRIGDIVTFGRYEQDNNLDNGPEEIDWIVLDIQGDKALLLSKYGLDAKQYNRQ